MCPPYLGLDPLNLRLLVLIRGKDGMGWKFP